MGVTVVEWPYKAAVVAHTATRKMVELPMGITPVERSAEAVPGRVVAVIAAAVVAYLEHEFRPARAHVETRVTNAWLHYGRGLMQRSHMPRGVGRVA